MSKLIKKMILDLAQKRLEKYYDFSTYSISQLPKNGIIFSNHNSMVDPPAVGIGLIKELENQNSEKNGIKNAPHFFSKEELFGNVILRYIMNSLEQIPIKREGMTRQELTKELKYHGNKIEEYLLKDEYIGYFYAGTRTNFINEEGGLEKEISNSKKGLLYMLNTADTLQEKISQVPIIPTLSYIERMDNKELDKSQIEENKDIFGYILGIKNPLNRKPSAKIFFGKPIEITLPISKKDYKEINVTLIESIFDMKKQYIE